MLLSNQSLLIIFTIAVLLLPEFTAGYCIAEELSLHEAISRSADYASSVLMAERRLTQSRLAVDVAQGSRYEVNLRGRLTLRSDNVIEEDNNQNKDSPLRRKLGVEFLYRLYDGKQQERSGLIATIKSGLDAENLKEQESIAMHMAYEHYLLAKELQEKWQFLSALRQEMQTFHNAVDLKVKKRKLLPYISLKIDAEIAAVDYLIFEAETGYREKIARLKILAGINGSVNLSDDFPDDLSEHTMTTLIDKMVMASHKINMARVNRRFEKKEALSSEQTRYAESKNSFKLNFVTSADINNSFAPSAPLFKAALVFKKKLAPPGKEIELDRVIERDIAFEKSVAQKELMLELQERITQIKRLRQELRWKQKRFLYDKEKYKILKLKYANSKLAPELMAGSIKEYYKGYIDYKKIKTKLYLELGKSDTVFLPALLKQ